MPGVAVGRWSRYFQEVHARQSEAVLQWSPEIRVQEALFVK